MKYISFALLLLIPNIVYAGNINGEPPGTFYVNEHIHLSPPNKDNLHKGDFQVSCCKGELKEGDLKRTPPFKDWPRHIKIINIDILEPRCACIGIDHIPFKELKHKHNKPD